MQIYDMNFSSPGVVYRFNNNSPGNKAAMKNVNIKHFKKIKNLFILKVKLFVGCRWFNWFTEEKWQTNFKNDDYGVISI